MVDLEKGLPGFAPYELAEPPELAGTSDWGNEEWQAEFEATCKKLSNFLSLRDPFVVLARTAVRFHLQLPTQTDGVDQIEQVAVEITQALLLLTGARRRTIPTSPGSFVRYWPALNRNIHAFLNKQRVDEEEDIARSVAHRARVQTVYYRNHFSKEGCEQTMAAILGRVDAQSETALGYRLSDLYSAFSRIKDLIDARLLAFFEHVAAACRPTSRDRVVEAINFFRSCYPLADRTWRNRTERFVELEELGAAAFQLSELAYPWAFTLGRELLEEEFATPVVDALYELALRPDDVADISPEHIYLGNPIWRQPFIALDDGGLFVALPQLAYSFPFAIIEHLIAGHEALETAYEKARSDYLENAIVDLIKTGMPSATVYRGVCWDDPESGKRYENDVVAIVGNFAFLFEAKSGRIKDAARRGGTVSLTKSFKELFVEPAEQAGRLQRYLETHGEKARLWLKAGGDIDLKLDRPKVFFTFSVCIEHFAALTSAKHYLKALGLVAEDTGWSPVLSIGELQMIMRFLDSEVAIIHYLTRRATLEQVLDFYGDEQDILSTYLTNGLWVDSEAVAGGKVVFINSDGPVRQEKIPRADRSEVDVFGISLSPMWAAIVRELYRDKSNRHRFDAINAILNQLPPALADIEKRVRKFRRGEPTKGEDVAFVKYAVGNKEFAVGAFLMKKMVPADEWQEAGRSLVGMLMSDGGGVECATFLFLRKSKRTTHDGMSFYRYIQRPKDEAKG
jgi:hypothetical protein